MSIRIPAPLHPALAGISLPPAPPAPAVAEAGGRPEAPQTQALAPIGLSFANWPDLPSAPVVRGDRVYPGDASDPRGVAEGIARLIFDPA